MMTFNPLTPKFIRVVLPKGFPDYLEPFTDATAVADLDGHLTLITDLEDYPHQTKYPAGLTIEINDDHQVITVNGHPIN